MLSFFALTKSNSFPYSSLLGERAALPDGEDQLRGGLNDVDTQGPGPDGRAGALNHTVHPNCSEPSGDSRKEGQTLVLKKEPAQPSAILGKEKQGGVYLVTKYAQSRRSAGEGTVSSFYWSIFHTSWGYYED